MVWNPARSPLTINRGQRLGRAEPAHRFEFGEELAVFHASQVDMVTQEDFPKEDAEGVERKVRKMPKKGIGGKEETPMGKALPTWSEMAKEGVFSTHKLGLEKSSKIPHKLSSQGVHVYDRPNDGTVARRFIQLVEKYPAIWKDQGIIKMEPGEEMRVPLVEGWQNYPVGQRAYPQGIEGRKFLDDTLDGLHDQDRMEWQQGPTPFAAPAFTHWRVAKDARKGRMVVDLRCLNRVAIPDAYPLPLQSDIIAMLRGKQFITVVDASAFFHQFPVAKEHQDRFTVITHRGLERSKVALMGFRNSPPHVQRYMDKILRPWKDSTKAYVDDIVIASDNMDDHLRDVERVFQLFAEKRISLSAKKSFLAYPSVQLLGFEVNALGLCNTEERVAALRSIPFPKTLGELDRWLGLTGFLRHLCPQYAARIDPLQKRKTQLWADARREGKDGGQARKAYGANRTWEPTEPEIRAFEEVRDILSSDTALVHMDPDRQLFVQLDASGTGMGAVLFHAKRDYVWNQQGPIPPAQVQPIMYLSRRVNDAESRYFATELEVACLTWVLRKTRAIIQSSRVNPVVIFTDHGATPGIMRQIRINSADTTRATTRLMRASLLCSEYNIRGIHVPGQTNVIADTLSRAPGQASEPSEVGELDRDWAEVYLANIQREVYHLRHLRHGTTTARMDDATRKEIREAYKEEKRWTKLIEAMPAEGDKSATPYYMEDDLLYLVEPCGKRRLVVPDKIVPRLLKQYHDDGYHCGENRMFHDINSSFVIYKLRSKIEDYVSTCPTCGENRTDRRPRIGRLQPILAPAIPFHTITMDFVVALPPAPATGTPFYVEGFEVHDAVLTVTDKFTKAVLLIPGNTTYGAREWGQMLLRAIQLGNWATPAAIISDRDSKFTSTIWGQLWESQGTALRMSTAWHPQTDGQSERTNQTMEIAIRFLAAEHPSAPWNNHLIAMQHHSNNTWHEVIKATPNQLLYGFRTKELRDLPADWDRDEERSVIQEEAKQSIARGQMFMKKRYDDKHRWTEFKPGDWVYLETKHYQLPGKPSRKFSQQRFAVQVKERVGHLAYRVDIPPTMHIHPVVSVQYISEATPPGTDKYGRGHMRPGAVESPAEEDKSAWRDEYQHYEVDRIKGKRKVRGRTEYLVAWKGWPAQFDIYMPEVAIEAKELIKEYEETTANMEALQGRLVARKGPEEKPQPGDLPEPRRRSQRKHRWQKESLLQDGMAQSPREGQRAVLGGSMEQLRQEGSEPEPTDGHATFPRKRGPGRPRKEGTRYQGAALSQTTK